MARRRIQTSAAAMATSPSSDDNELPPFFNTTFSTHRVSPLYIGGDGLTPARLEVLSHRLRDTLVGDVVRGIQVGLEATDTPMGQVGPLRAVRIRWAPASKILGGGPTDGDQGTDERALWIEIRHENAAYVAILLPGFSEDAGSTAPAAQDWAMQQHNARRGASADPSHFCNLPLLLLRMPQALKAVLSDWLSTTFDCRVSKLTLGTRTIVNAFEGWAKDAGLPGKGPDFVLTLAFNAPLADLSNATDNNAAEESAEVGGPGLRSMDITISPQDLRRFVRAGTSEKPQGETSSLWTNDARERRRLAGGNSDDGWAWRAGQSANEQPFTEALARYLDHHLALNLFHPSVRVTQISCAGFVLGQSRLKILKEGELSTRLQNAAWIFVAQLGERVQSEQLPQVFSTKD